ncbi:MAG: B12-binding domain-containing radical SAM protein [Clostridiaceae bacterium]|nr:B12-binding domain-containing radical SAM protein [Clostridiaceae bacterium]
MKLLLTAVNAKYIHTNLAVRYLKQSLAGVIEDIIVEEFTINNSKAYILNEIYKIQPEVIAFSCYIWNMEMIHDIAQLIKKVMPHITIILGGPEVSFDVKKVMEHNDAIDIIVMGEGEKTFLELIKALNRNEDYSEITSIAFRARGEIFIKEDCSEPIAMEEIPFPYSGEVLDKDKIVYYESSRGCPFNCQYCLSSAFAGVRFKPIELVKKELKYLIDEEVKQVKFIDRTFNAKKDYALEIMRFITDNNKGKTNFHLEVTADLLDEEVLNFLNTAPVGLFQFEIGVQSTNKETLQEIQRNMDFERLTEVVKRIAKGRNIHQHLDLIIGLPKEDYFSFRQSFDDVFSLKPEKLQVGFLKLLKGSGLRKNALKYGYVYDEKPPYEVLENDAISYGEVLRLKGIEEMVESYWNTRMFHTSIELIITNFYSSPFKFFEELWRYWESKGYHHNFHSKNKLYEVLLDFYKYKEFDGEPIFKDVLKFDFLKNHKTSSIPKFFNVTIDADFKNQSHKFLQDTSNLEKYLPKFQDIPAKQIIKKVHFEAFDYNVHAIAEAFEAIEGMKTDKTIILFDYDLENKAIDSSKHFVLNKEAFYKDNY